jgi:hypothetical protein
MSLWKPCRRTYPKNWMYWILACRAVIFQQQKFRVHIWKCNITTLLDRSMPGRTRRRKNMQKLPAQQYQPERNSHNSHQKKKLYKKLHHHQSLPLPI